MLVGDRSILSLAIVGLFGLMSASVQAQLIPDTSLGQENSVVTGKDQTTNLIEGGAIRDRNLFHSFTEFNVINGSAVYFANPDGVTNILTRVTGNNISEIFGTLGVDGAANLFLLNPNGIVFGENSSLDVSGSFLATTAESYLFQNEFEYSAANPETPPLLTINLPIGVQFGVQTGTITNRSQHASNDELIQGLKIHPQQTLSLIGGSVLLAGGYLSTSQGNIDIGSVAPENKVYLLPDPYGWTLDYQEVTSFADITINNAGKIDAGAIGGSNVSLTGKNISLGYDLKTIAQVGYELDDFFTLQPLPQVDHLPSNPANITASNADNPIPSQISITASKTFSLTSGANINAVTTGTEVASTIAVTADTAVIYDGGLEANSQENSSGNAGQITFNANRMSVQQGGAGVNTLGLGDGGAIKLNIAGILQIRQGGFGADTVSSGNGGKIQIHAHDLEVLQGGAGVNTLGSGDGGAIELNIAGILQIRQGGFGADTVSSGNGGKIQIHAKTLDIFEGGIGVNARNDIGKGGEIQIEAETIILENAVISSESGKDPDETFDFDSNQLQVLFGQQDAGDGGKIYIEADSLQLNNGGNITTTTFGVGNAGAIELQANLVQLKGNEATTIRSSTEASASGNGGNITIFSNEIEIADKASITANSRNIGNAGNISLDANQIIRLQNQGKISVDGGIEGGSGNITLSGNKIDLSQGSNISAQVNRGNEGNIRITGNNLFLSDRSQITTNATNNSSGGNIIIDLTGSLLTLTNSSIVSNAVVGRGGKIQIQTKGLFSSLDSTIEASSELGLDGTVEISTFDVESNYGLLQLPDQPIDPSFYLTQGCGVRSNYSLVNVGRGGFPTSPLNSITYHDVLPDIEITASQKESELLANKTPQSVTKLSLNKIQENSLVEAQTWQISPQGNIELVADTDTNFTLASNNFSCHPDTNRSNF